MKHPNLIPQNRQSIHWRPHAIWSCKRYIKHLDAGSGSRHALVYMRACIFSYTHAVCDLLHATVVSNATLSTPCDASTWMFRTDNTQHNAVLFREMLFLPTYSGYWLCDNGFYIGVKTCILSVSYSVQCAYVESLRRAVRRILCGSTRRASKRQRLLTISWHWQRVSGRQVCFSLHSHGRSLSAL